MRFTGRLSFTGSFGLGTIKEFRPERPRRYCVPLGAGDFMGARYETGRSYVELAAQCGYDLTDPNLRTWRTRAMGLSKLTNSEAPRKRRGTGGITSLGKRRVRECCEFLQRRFGRQRLTFCTLSLPSLPDSEMEQICDGWAGLVHKLQKAIAVRQKRAGLPVSTVGVTEIQPERSEREARPVLHLHLVWVGRSRGSGWSVTTQEIDKIWGALLSNVLGRDVNVSSACKLQSVRKSASGYLGKYLSKGYEQTNRWCNTWYFSWLPTAWWFASLSLRRACEGVALRGERVGGMLRWLLDIESSDVKRWFQVTIGADNVPVGWGGEVTERGLNEIYEALGSLPPSELIKAIELV